MAPPCRGNGVPTKYWNTPLGRKLGCKRPQAARAMSVGSSYDGRLEPAEWELASGRGVAATQVETQAEHASGSPTEEESPAPGQPADLREEGARAAAADELAPARAPAAEASSDTESAAEQEDGGSCSKGGNGQTITEIADDAIADPYTQLAAEEVMMGGFGQDTAAHYGLLSSSPTPTQKNNQRELMGPPIDQALKESEITAKKEQDIRKKENHLIQEALQQSQKLAIEELAKSHLSDDMLLEEAIKKSREQVQLDDMKRRGLSPPIPHPEARASKDRGAHAADRAAGSASGSASATSESSGPAGAPAGGGRAGCLKG